MTASLGALLLPAAAGAAAHKTPSPRITSISPKILNVGDRLTIRGRYFRRGRHKDTVVFQARHARAVFVKADLATTKKIYVTIPAKLTRQMLVRRGVAVATRFQLRVMTGRLGRLYTANRLSPLIGPKPAVPMGPAATAPDGDCDHDGILNAKDSDDDNDLLPDTLEKSIGTQPCNADSDGDGVLDGYEYQSARDLNDDNYQNANRYLPYPGKRPYPNPLYKDANSDYDGDGLTLADEQKLWRASGVYSLAAPLSYSDGRQYSIGQFGADGRWHGTLHADGYAKQQSFLSWAAATPNPETGVGGYSHVLIQGTVAGGPTFNSTYDIRDLNLNGTLSNSERLYYDFDGDGLLSDDERDEDGDGLTNFDETHGRVLPGYWSGCYSAEAAYPVAYAGTDPTDPDTDGDGVRDGADDQDHDDVPNIMELSRSAASGQVDWSPVQCKPMQGLPTPPATWHANLYGRVNPFNPCLPFTDSRTCERHPTLSTAAAPFDNSPNWYSLQ